MAGLRPASIGQSRQPLSGNSVRHQGLSVFLPVEECLRGLRLIPRSDCLINKSLPALRLWKVISTGTDPPFRARDVVTVFQTNSNRINCGRIARPRRLFQAGIAAEHIGTERPEYKFADLLRVILPPTCELILIGQAALPARALFRKNSAGTRIRTAGTITGTGLTGMSRFQSEFLRMRFSLTVSTAQVQRGLTAGAACREAFAVNRVDLRD